MVGLGFFNYFSLKDYERSIRSIRNSTLEQLTLINEISISVSRNQNFMVHYLYSTELPRQELLAKRVEENIVKVTEMFIKLKDILANEKSLENFELVYETRIKYIENIRETIEGENPEVESETFSYVESEILENYEEFMLKLQAFSGIIISDAEENIAITLSKVTKARFVGNLAISLVILVLFLNSYLMLRIYKRLTLDYHNLQMEKTEKEKAKMDLERLNKELESKVKGRTKELEQANREARINNVELKKLSQAKDKFISVISHDLRGPISTIVASSDALLKIRETESEEKEAAQFIKIINKASQKVIKQLNELVEWSKTMNIHKAFNPVKLNLWEAVNESLQLLESLSEQKEIRLENKVPASLFVKADKNMLRSVIQNLATNSIKFTPGPGYVTINAKEKGKMTEIEISDTGLGMDEKMIENLFNDSKPVENLEQAKQSGLGLILVKDFIEKHGGSITVESSPGKGSKFTFTIPSTSP